MVSEGFKEDVLLGDHFFCNYVVNQGCREDVLLGNNFAGVKFQLTWQYYREQKTVGCS